MLLLGLNEIIILTCLTRFLADSRWLSDQKLYLAWARSDAKEGTPNEQVGIKMMGRWSQASWHPGRPVSPGAEELTAAGLGCGLRLGLPPRPVCGTTCWLFMGGEVQ